jgi:F-type H+-transporting ATPase subunit delta
VSSGSIQIARAYAEALIDLAEAQGNLGRVVDDLHAVQELVDKDETFRLFFLSPRLERADKKRILNEAIAGELDRPVLGLLNLLVDKRREPVFDNIVQEFDRFKDIREGRLHVHVTTAKPLAEDQQADIRSKLEQATGKTILIHERVDARLLGGIIVKLGDKVIDGTARRRLDKLGKALAAAGDML